MEKTKGISLLEMLFVIVIGAAVVVSAFRYFGVTNRSVRVTHAIQQVTMLTQTSYEWLDSQSQDNFSSADGGTAISMQQLIDAGLIKNNNKETRDPWNGNITIEPGSDPTKVQITLTQIPKKTCKDLAKRLDKKSKITMPNCANTYSNYTGEF